MADRVHDDLAAAGRELQAIAAAQADSPVFDPLAFEQAAALAAPLVRDRAAQDAVARVLGVDVRLADDWLRDTLGLLAGGDQADATVRERGARRIGVLALAWRPD